MERANYESAREEIANAMYSVTACRHWSIQHNHSRLENELTKIELHLKRMAAEIEEADDPRQASGREGK